MLFMLVLILTGIATFCLWLSWRQQMLNKSRILVRVPRPRQKRHSRRRWF